MPAERWTPAGGVRNEQCGGSTAWASDCGHDANGPWAELWVEGQTMRLRWIPPGEFTMGSPADEAGCSSDEVQHQARLTKGF